MIHPLPLLPEATRRAVGRYIPWAAQGSWSPLYGGRTNSAWQLCLGDHCVVLKLYRAPALNPLFPNEADAEARLLAHLKGQALSPDLIATFETEDGRCNLYQAIPGERWTQDTVAVAQLMKRLHAIAPPPDLRDIPSGSAALLAHADHILAQCKSTDTLGALRPAGDVPATSERVLLHCDIVPGNLICNATGLHLIDWQCPGVGDACDDIAVFVSPAMQLLYRGHALTKAEKTDFLSAYGGAAAQRYAALARFYHFRMAAYCQWQIENGNPDYAAGLAIEVEVLKG